MIANLQELLRTYNNIIAVPLLLTLKDIIFPQQREYIQ